MAAGTAHRFFLHFHSPSSHSLSFFFFPQGDKGERGRDGTDGRKVSLDKTNNAVLAACCLLDLMLFDDMMIFLFCLFFLTHQGEAGFAGLPGCKGSPGSDVSPQAHGFGSFNTIFTLYRQFKSQPGGHNRC